MQDHCCWEEFVDRSGYRFELLGVSLSSAEVTVGGTVSFSLEVQNTGWSSLYTPRRGYLSLFQYLVRGDVQTMEVDGSVEEWAAVQDGFVDEYSPGTAAAADVSSVQVTNDADFVYIRVSFHNVSDGRLGLPMPLCLLLGWRLFLVALSWSLVVRVLTSIIKFDLRCVVSMP